MRVVWKYMVDLGKGVHHELDIPEDGQFLALRDSPRHGLYSSATHSPSNPQVEMWFAVDPTRPTEKRKFSFVGTGNTIPDDSYYRGTCFPVPNIVLHVWDHVTRAEPKSRLDEMYEGMGAIPV